MFLAQGATKISVAEAQPSTSTLHLDSNRLCTADDVNKSKANHCEVYDVQDKKNPSELIKKTQIDVYEIATTLHDKYEGANITGTF